MIDRERIKVIVLDADDTLFRVRDGIEGVYARFLAHHGKPSEATHVRAALVAAWRETLSDYYRPDELYQASHHTDLAVWRIFCLRVVRRLGDIDDFDAFFDDVYWHFAKAESRELNLPAIVLLEALQDTGIRTGLLTNNDQRIHPLLRELEVAHLFEFALCASDVGYRKPSPECFEAVRVRFGVLPSECLYIGDSYEDDYQGATAAGWQAVLLIPEHGDRLVREIPKSGLSGIPSIRCFSELHTHLFGNEGEAREYERK